MVLRRRHLSERADCTADSAAGELTKLTSSVSLPSIPDGASDSSGCCTLSSAGESWRKECELVQRSLSAESIWTSASASRRSLTTSAEARRGSMRAVQARVELVEPKGFVSP